MGDGITNSSSSTGDGRTTSSSSSPPPSPPRHRRHGESKQQEQQQQHRSLSMKEEQESSWYGEASVVSSGWAGQNNSSGIATTTTSSGGSSRTAAGGEGGGRRTPIHDSSDHDSAVSHPEQAIRLSMIGTPSTASTAPSSADEASIGTSEYRLDETVLPNLLHPLGDHDDHHQHQHIHIHHQHPQHQLHHRRIHSWEHDVLLPTEFNQQPMNFAILEGGPGNNNFAAVNASLLPPPPSHNPWGNTVVEGLSGTNMGQLLAHRHHHHQQSHQSQWGGCTPQTPTPSQHRPSQHPQMQHQHGQYSSHPEAQSQRVAVFRNEGSWAQHVVSGAQQQKHQQQQPHNLHNATQKESLHVPAGVVVSPYPSSASTNRVARQPAARNQANRQSPAVETSPSGPHQQHQQSSSPHQHTTSTGAPSHRSSSEVLKTLLRKKACLYEPDTSRSVALVTWLVGRELALEHGFFSRQQLQSGVHACVASKIDSGIITRTKVNRCMQIILNSCFHYIIPRSDGTEESGESFRAIFASAVQDDLHLLQYLPEPWNDLFVNREAVLEASAADADEHHTTHEKTGKYLKESLSTPLSTPKSSPKLKSVNSSVDKSFDKDGDHHDGDHDSKRSVLLCFNENVRSAEDVFRCHNEFIRDTANASHLQLTAQEWQNFFGREVSRSPHLWGSVGIPTLTGESNAGPARQPDLLGQMSREEAAKFRTTWCTKRYEHNHDLCGFAHAEVNGGWLRRNPTLFPYKDDMCPYIATVKDKQIGPNPFFLNECPNGVMCEHAHSTEEMLFHPTRYKTTVCGSLYSRSNGCRLGDVCPHLHPPESTRPMKKSEGRSHGHRRKNSKDANAAGHTGSVDGGNKALAALAPSGATVVYASPAPLSSFEQQLLLPGLRDLYRRHSAVVRAYVRSSGNSKALYSPFGDDLGISVNTNAVRSPAATTTMLPNVVRPLAGGSVSTARID